MKAVGYHGGMACYLVFEGIDGSGKTTLVRRLAECLCKQGLRVEVVSEPYDFPREVNDFFSQIVGWTENPWLKVCYYQAGRLLLQTRLSAIFRSVGGFVGPMESEPFVLLQDRSFISTMVYQAYDLSLDHHPSLLESFWRMIVDVALRNAIRPDLVFLMEPPPEVSNTSQQCRLKELYRRALVFLEREYLLRTQTLRPGLWQDPDAYEAVLAMLTDLTLKSGQGLDKPVVGGV